MTRTGKAGEFLPCERMFVLQLKLVGDKFPTIREKFMNKVGSPAGQWWSKNEPMKAMAKR